MMYRVKCAAWHLAYFFIFSFPLFLVSSIACNNSYSFILTSLFSLCNRCSILCRSAPRRSPLKVGMRPQ